MKPLCFLDRDGTIIVDVGYPRDPAEVRLMPGAAEALVLLAKHYQLAVVSNQSGIARGRITPAEAEAVHRRFVEVVFEATQTELEAWYCPHGPTESCACRKPAPGLLQQAAAHFGMQITRNCVMIGDKPSDVKAGQNAGCGKNFLFTTWPEILEQLVTDQA
jgi:D-glycero-D-manno-heptose 1,7-bisphosphate phosphatase